MARRHLSIFVFCVLLVAELSAANGRKIDEQKGGINRPSRQATTTPAPKRRPSNIFSLFRVLLAETRDDARRAFSNIGQIFSSQFANSTSTRPVSGATSSSSTTTTPATGTDGEVSSTTEPYRITRDEFNGILMNNFRGIFRLFGRELGNAIRDSNRNVRQFGRDLRDQIRPYVTSNSTTSN